MTKGETIHTWADGFGNWQARVEFPSPGYGPQHLSANADRIRAKARRAIKRELMTRGECDPSWRCRIEVKDNDLDHLNRMHSLTYGEVVR